ncbi:MAG: hydantoinase/oxoprolinase family protein [Pseudolabrys sp.]
MAIVVGWDIGGAHLKAARAEDGRIVAAVQVAAPLKFGVARLAEAFAEAKAGVGEADRHAITMTGELADTFASRAEGVAALTAAAQQELGADVRVYAGRAGFIAPDEAGNHVVDIASANWFASASVVARTLDSVLFLDMGSTTTDVIPIVDGAVASHGYTDAERLASGELVYTGLVRSFVMASAGRVPFAGSWTELIRENFANMGDVHRILGSLPDGADQMPTADGRPKTVAASRARLARMVGRDVDDADEAAWTALARWFAETQVRAVTDGVSLALSRVHLAAEAPVVVAGVGVGILREVARRLGRDVVDFNLLLDATPAARAAVSLAAPAVAVAVLASAIDARESGGTAKQSAGAAF